MQIADLHEAPIAQFRGQPADRQVALDDFDPMRLDSPRVKPRPARAQRQSRQKAATRQPRTPTARGLGLRLIADHFLSIDSPGMPQPLNAVFAVAEVIG